MSAVDEQTVRHVAKLARLQLTDSEVSQFTSELSKILVMVAQLDEVDLTDVILDAHETNPSVFRSDIVSQVIDKAALLANAPAPEGDYFQVPKILES